VRGTPGNVVGIACTCTSKVDGNSLAYDSKKMEKKTKYYVVCMRVPGVLVCMRLCVCAQDNVRMFVVRKREMLSRRCRVAVRRADTRAHFNRPQRLAAAVRPLEQIHISWRWCCVALRSATRRAPQWITENRPVDTHSLCGNEKVQYLDHIIDCGKNQIQDAT